MIKRILLYLKLIRVPNGVTAMADSVAGYLILTPYSNIDYSILFYLAISSFCLYSAGIILNDLRDIKVDSAIRCFRVLPSGLVSIFEAKILMVVLFFCGLFFALMVGGFVLFSAFILVISIFLYDVVFKHNIYIAPFVMGLCRFLNFLCGMSACDKFLGNYTVIFYPLSIFGYVSLLTFISRFEFFVNKSRFIAGVLVIWVSISYCICCFMGLLPNFYGIFVLALFLFFLGYLVLSKLKIDMLIRYLILGIVFLDAVLVAGSNGMYPSLMVLIFFAGSFVLSLFIKMT